MLEDLKGIENNWETIGAFADYFSTINELDDIDKTIQKKKFTHFIRYVKESLNCHFKRWTRESFFLSLFSNQPTASIVARILKGQETAGMQDEIMDEYHKKKINKERFEHQQPTYLFHY